MAKKLNSQEIEAARRTGSCSQRREEERKRLHDEIKQSQKSGGVVVIPPPQIHYAEGESALKLRVAAYCRVGTQEEQ